MRVVAAVAWVAAVWTMAFAGCLDEDPVPFCSGEPIEHDGIRFAWPPHLASELTRAESADCLASGTGLPMDLVIVEGETDVRVEHPTNGTVRVVVEPPGAASGSFDAPYSPVYDDRSCLRHRSLDGSNDTFNQPCAHPSLTHIAVDWRDRPGALVVDGHKVHLVLRPGSMASGGEPLATAHELMDALGIPPFTANVHESTPAWPLPLTPSDGTVWTEFNEDGQTEDSVAAAMDRVFLTCEGCVSYRMAPSGHPTTSAEAVEFVVDPNGDVAWVSAEVAIDWDETTVLSLAERDAAVDAFADKHRLEQAHPVARGMMLHREPWHLTWKVDFRYLDHEVEGQGGAAMMHLNALFGNWTVELDGGLTDGSGTTTYPLAAVYEDAGFWS